MYNSNILIKIRLSISSPAILDEFIILLEHLLPPNTKKGILKRYSFQNSLYDTDRNVYSSSIDQWKQLIFNQSEKFVFFQTSNNRHYYFDCLKCESHLLISICIPSNKYHTKERLFSLFVSSALNTSSQFYYITSNHYLTVDEYAEKQYNTYILQNCSIKKLNLFRISFC